MTEVHEEQQHQHEQADDEDHEAGALQLSLHAKFIDLKEGVQFIELHAHILREGGVLVKVHLLIKQSRLTIPADSQ